MKLLFSYIVSFLKDKSGLIVTLIFLFLAIRYCDRRSDIQIESNVDLRYIDSVENIISSLNDIIANQASIIDSLNRITPEIVYKYESDIKNISSPVYISDDSIYRYIREKISHY